MSRVRCHDASAHPNRDAPPTAAARKALYAGRALGGEAFSRILRHNERVPDLTLRLDEADLTVTFAGVDIARYAFAPGGAPSEGPKPFLHPVRALDGAPLTAYRPWDHRWHKGLQMTWTHVSGQNFWGGNTYRPEHGDYALLDNVGRMRHDGFTAMTRRRRPRSSFTEDAHLDHRGRRGLGRRGRGPTASTASTPRAASGCSTSRRRCGTSAGRDLEFGSPTTQGRPNARLHRLRASGCRGPGPAAACWRAGCPTTPAPTR